MTEIRKATDGKTRLREGWDDITARFSAEEIERHDLAPDLRRDAYPHKLWVTDSFDGTWEWSVRHYAVSSSTPAKQGYAKTPAEGMRRADAAHERLVARYQRVL